MGRMQGSVLSRGNGLDEGLESGKECVGWPKNREKAHGEQSGEVVSKVLCSRP